MAVRSWYGWAFSNSTCNWDVRKVEGRALDPLASAAVISGPPHTHSVFSLDGQSIGGEKPKQRVGSSLDG